MRFKNSFVNRLVFKYELAMYPGEVLPQILDRGVPRRFMNPYPKKGKLIPFLRTKAEK